MVKIIKTTGRALGCAILVLLLAGCVTDDPAQGGFIGGLVGDLSGKYDQRIAKRQATLADASQRTDRAEAEQGELEAAAARQRAEARALEREVALVQRDLDGLNRSIATLQEQERSSQEAVGSIEAEVAGIVADLDEVKLRAHQGEAESGQRATLLRAEVQKLQQEVDALLAAE